MCQINNFYICTDNRGDSVDLLYPSSAFSENRNPFFRKTVLTEQVLSDDNDIGKAFIAELLFSTFGREYSHDIR